MDAAAALAWMGASGNGRHSVSAMYSASQTGEGASMVQSLGPSLNRLNWKETASQSFHRRAQWSSWWAACSPQLSSSCLHYWAVTDFFLAHTQHTSDIQLSLLTYPIFIASYITNTSKLAGLKFICLWSILSIDSLKWIASNDWLIYWLIDWLISWLE